MPTDQIAVLAGGVGAARMLAGILQVREPSQVTAIVNVGDDLELHGLRISPDLDTITYTLAGEINPETGWGLRGESWQAMDTVRRYGGVSWFGLGDRDLGTHLHRTHRLGEGATLTEVTADSPAAAAGLEPGDVVTKVGSVRIDDASDLVLALRDRAPGDEVLVSIRHDGKATKVQVTLGG